MNSDKLRNVIAFIRGLNHTENEVRLCYNMIDCTLEIANEFGLLRYKENCSLTNFNKILMTIKKEKMSNITKIDVYCQKNWNNYSHGGE